MRQPPLPALFVLVFVACEPPKVVSPAHTHARFTRDSAAVHTLVLDSSVHDTSAALVAWVNAINGDLTHDTVWGVIPKGNIHLKYLPATGPQSGWGGLRLYTDGNYPNRVVDISGYSKDSSTIYVDASATAPDGYGAFLFIVQASQVRFHDFSITSLADTAAVLDSTAFLGNNDEAIRFDRYTPADQIGSDQKMYAQVYNLVIRDFRVGGIDVHGMKGVFIHDNAIFCPAMNSTTHYNGAMGVWMRDLALPTPPGVTNGTIQANTIWDCGAEGVSAEDVQNVQIRWNTISCQGGSSCPQGFYHDSQPSIGIALYSSFCVDSLALINNRVDRNYIYGNRSLTGGIIIAATGGANGLGSGNTIDSNVVHEVLTTGIATGRGHCSGDTTISHNVIARNTVDSTSNTLTSSYQDFFSGGHPDTVTYNGACRSNSAHAYNLDPSVDSIGNFLNSC